MEYNNSKEIWINEVLESTKGMVRPEPGAVLYDRIMHRLSGSNDNIKVRIPVREWAAAAIILLAVNAGSVVYYAIRNHKNAAISSGSSLSLEIESTPTYNY